MEHYSELNRNFYDRNAEHFSKTRNIAWPITQRFLEKFSPFSRIVDIGCGNGRNMLYRDDLNIEGIDASKELCKIAQSRGLSVVHGCMTKLPFKSKSYDGALMVASLHHLYYKNDRHQAIQEAWRVLRPGGLLYIHVWAMEQPLNSRRVFRKTDEIVGWWNAGSYSERYYRIYRKGELQKEVWECIPKAKLLNEEYSLGNWVCTFRKDYT